MGEGINVDVYYHLRIVRHAICTNFQPQSLNASRCSVPSTERKPPTVIHAFVVLCIPAAVHYIPRSRLFDIRVCFVMHTMALRSFLRYFHIRSHLQFCEWKIRCLLVCLCLSVRFLFI